MTVQEYWQKYQPQPRTPDLYAQMTFGFDINEMHTKEVNGTPNVVYKVSYSIWGDHQGTRGKIARELEFPQDVLDAQTSFTSYDQLTEATVIGWIEDNTSYIHSHYTLANQMAEQPEAPTALPW